MSEPLDDNELPELPLDEDLWNDAIPDSDFFGDPYGLENRALMQARTDYLAWAIKVINKQIAAGDVPEIDVLSLMGTGVVAKAVTEEPTLLTQSFLHKEITMCLLTLFVLGYMFAKNNYLSGFKEL